MSGPMAKALAVISYDIVLGTRDNLPLTFHLFLCTIQLTVYMRITKPVLGQVNLGGRVVSL